MFRSLAALALFPGLRRLPGITRTRTNAGTPRTMVSTAKRRLAHMLDTLAAPTETVGTLTLGDIAYDIPVASEPSKLPHSRSQDLLDTNDPVNADNLHFMLQKFLLGQDIFLVSQPGPYARRLAMTFASIINSEYEYIALHRDVGETELKQVWSILISVVCIPTPRREGEIHSGGNLVYVDSPAVNAVKHGRILILEGIEKAERGIMPVLNNLLENREMNLDDGTHIIHPHRFAQLETSTDDSGNLFLPAHKNFRVIAIAAPVPPFPGYPLDPPFRSRFQARFVDPVGAFLALCASSTSAPESELESRLRELVLSTQYASEARDALSAVSKSALPPFPQTALQKLRALTSAFPPPPPGALSPMQLARLMVTLHPALVFAPMQAWAILSRQTEEMGLGELGSPVSAEEDGADHGAGLLGYTLARITRLTSTSATVVFTHPAASLPDVSLTVPAGPAPLRPFPFSSTSTPQSQSSSPPFTPSPRFLGLLTALVQAHTLGWDASLVPPAAPATASSSTSTLVRVFGEVLGYAGANAEAVHMYKELGGRELLMRRRILDGGATAAIVEAAWAGKLVHLSGLDVIGPTAGALARLVQDREAELWGGKRIVADATRAEIESSSGALTLAHPSFRLIATASKSLPLKDWLSAEHANMFFPVPAQPMGRAEEEAILLATGCPAHVVRRMLAFAERYRASMSEDSVKKNRKLGTRSLAGMGGDLRGVLSRTLLLEFLPAVERMNVEQLFDEADIARGVPAHHPSPYMHEDALVFPGPSTSGGPSYATRIPLFNIAEDTLGVKSHVPYMDHFYDNSLQTELMRDLAVDLELLREHVVLLGNQGVGKNKIVDRWHGKNLTSTHQLLGRPREYIQLHRDTTVNQLMFTTSLENGIIKYTDSPLLRAIAFGRVIIIDEADKVPEHVVAIFRSLAGQSELSLSDGRRVRATKERPSDIAVHPNFRLVLLANRPGYPFLGNHFLQVLGETFSAHSVTNPDQESERTLLAQLAPEIDEDLILRLVGAFHDLRKGYDAGTLNYPYSLRELINLIKHMQAFPHDSLGDALRNVFDFDVYKPETIEQLAAILAHHGLGSHAPNLGLAAAREAAKKKIQDVKFEPKNTELGEPKEGDHDDKEHHGGNKWAGGTGGRDTAGLGGRGGYKRWYKGGDIKQVLDELRRQVPDHVQEKAREMARQELQRRLEELDMSTSQAAGYGGAVEGDRGAHDLAAKEEERVWVKRQTDGELDDSRLTEGITGEATVYKRRGMDKPELGRPQMKPKRIRFLFDLSASMYRFQYDGRLQRSMETAVMLMETFDRLSRKEKYVWDVSIIFIPCFPLSLTPESDLSEDSPGMGADIPLVEASKPPTEMKDRWKVVEKMLMIPQYAFAGDYTVEAIEKGVKDVGAFDADDWFVIAITDANFGRYLIKPEDISRAMRRDPKVHTALVCIGEGAEATWIPKSIPGRGYRVTNTADIPTVLRSILSTMVDR
ncbi:von Willebrand factor A domain-containing protein 8 [Mycena sanguinolenta]|uniref:von Willebrand factor A domain-containing protein 8 n=1 Tax=Mycena sanguinolenta TaxID=230812 RepID=A0A8H7D9J2_9AGAR|nr:von Willebrand factor A domain-containing protein 8 [Mycena sanguinolenta]